MKIRLSSIITFGYRIQMSKFSVGHNDDLELPRRNLRHLLAQERLKFGAQITEFSKTGRASKSKQLAKGHHFHLEALDPIRNEAFKSGIVTRKQARTCLCFDHAKPLPLRRLNADRTLYLDVYERFLGTYYEFQICPLAPYLALKRLPHEC
jgi:hypothetical protein